MPNLSHINQPTRLKRTTLTNEGLPVIKPAPDFVYVVYENGWAYDHECGEWLPYPQKIAAVPGANGVRNITDRSGRIIGVDMSRAIAGAQGKGGAIVATDDSRLGAFVDYVGIYKTEAGANHHVWAGKEGGKGETGIKLRSGAVLWNSKDQDVRQEWREFKRVIRDTGICPPMTWEVYKLKVATQQKRLELEAHSYGAKPALAHKIELQQDVLDGMHKAWEKMQKASTPSTTQPRRQRLKTPTNPDEVPPDA